MVFYILLILVSIFALYWSYTYRNIPSIIITVGMVLGISLVLFPYLNLKVFGLYFYLFFVAMALGYGVRAKELETSSRMVIGLMAASIIAYWLWVLNHWQGNTILFPILTILVGLFGVVRKQKLKYELGFLAILFVDAIAILVEYWMKMMYY